MLYSYIAVLLIDGLWDALFFPNYTTWESVLVHIQTFSGHTQNQPKSLFHGTYYDATFFIRICLPPNNKLPFFIIKLDCSLKPEQIRVAKIFLPAARWYLALLSEILQKLVLMSLWQAHKSLNTSLLRSVIILLNDDFFVRMLRALRSFLGSLARVVHSVFHLPAVRHVLFGEALATPVRRKAQRISVGKGTDFVDECFPGVC